MRKLNYSAVTINFLLVLVLMALMGIGKVREIKLRTQVRELEVKLGELEATTGKLKRALMSK